MNANNNYYSYNFNPRNNGSYQLNSGYRPDISSNYSYPNGSVIYPFDKPFANNCTTIGGCFKTDPPTKKGFRQCDRQCDDPNSINVLYYMFGKNRGPY